jgi:hypothetical protein
MGNFYKNITVLGPAHEAVVAALENHRRTAYVSPTEAGITVVFDRDSEENGDPVELGDLSLILSRDLSCVALAAAVYDDDVLLLSLYDRGSELGEYNSAQTSSLSSAALAKAFRVQKRTPLVAAVLRSPHLPVFAFESMRHGLLIKLLRVPRWAASTGYRYLLHGEHPPGLDPSLLRHIKPAG